MIKKTEAFTTEDGVLHLTLAAAVAHDLNIAIAAIVLDPDAVQQGMSRATVRTVADLMATDAKLRSDVLALLRALLGSLS